MFTVRSPTTESRKCTKEVGSYLKINVQLFWRPCSSSSVTRINQLNVGSGSGSGSVWGARPAASSRSTVAQQSVTAALPVGMLPSRKVSNLVLSLIVISVRIYLCIANRFLSFYFVTAFILLILKCH